MEGFDSPKNVGAEAFPQKQATPEQQKQFDKFIDTAKTLLYSDKFLQIGAKILSEAATIVDGMARIGASIATRIFMQANKEGAMIEAIVLVEGGRVIMQEIGDFTKALGHEITEDDMMDAYLMGAEMVRKTLDDAGMLNPEDMEKDIAMAKEYFTEDDFNQVFERMDKTKQAVVERLSPGDVQ